MENPENKIASQIISTSFKIHKKPGPGLLESVYEEVLCYEISKLNLFIERQKPIPLISENIKLDIGFRTDIIVENKIIIE